MTENCKSGDCETGGSACVVSPDGRQSATAAEIARGTVRYLIELGHACVAELPLPNGQRADITVLSPNGRILIVEIKSCLNDFRTDQKWSGYRDFCDELYFAVKSDFPVEVLPDDAGLILADRYGAETIRPAPESPMTAARRKAMTLRFARAAALRLSASLDPALKLALSGNVP